MRLVTITTDFGLESEGPGIMEATILAICPQARVVQLCNSVSSFSTSEGARQLECAVALSIPAIHITVVDPGVGTDRRALVLELPGDVLLVGPDNGVLIPAALKGGGILNARQISNPRMLRHPVSSTFHGRDVFASVAAHLAAGEPLDDVGPRLTAGELIDAPYQNAKWIGTSLTATVIRVNSYGNCILNVSDDEVHGNGARPPFVRLKRGAAVLDHATVASAFGSVAVGSVVLYPDAYGRVGIAVNQGNVAKKLRLAVGDEICLERSSP
jgi:S-adenosyl-L-methionine hydrolase (adenosine-forming)